MVSHISEGFSVKERKTVVMSHPEERKHIYSYHEQYYVNITVHTLLFLILVRLLICLWMLYNYSSIQNIILQTEARECDK